MFTSTFVIARTAALAAEAVRNLGSAFGSALAMAHTNPHAERGANETSALYVVVLPQSAFDRDTMLDWFRSLNRPNWTTLFVGPKDPAMPGTLFATRYRLDQGDIHISAFIADLERKHRGNL